MDLGVRTWGNSPRARPSCSPARTSSRARSAAACCARCRRCSCSRPAKRRHAHRAARRRDRQGRAGPGGRARPHARPPADLDAARLVLTPGGAGARVLPRAERPGRRRRAANAAEQPGHPWSVASLAKATNVSRAALARRFNELVGEPPMTFYRLAAGPRRRPVVRDRRDDQRGRRAGRLRQPVCAEHGVQARARRQPAAAPHALAGAGVLTNPRFRRSCRTDGVVAASSMRMNEPVARLRAYGSKAIGLEVRRRTRPMSLRPSSPASARASACGRRRGRRPRRRSPARRASRA